MLLFWELSYSINILIKIYLPYILNDTSPSFLQSTVHSQLDRKILAFEITYCIVYTVRTVSVRNIKEKL